MKWKLLSEKEKSKARKRLRFGSLPPLIDFQNLLAERGGNKGKADLCSLAIDSFILRAFAICPELIHGKKFQVHGSPI